VITAEEDGTKTWPDPDLLNRATSLGRALFSQDEDLLAEVARRQHSGEPFAGVIYAHQLHTTIGQCVNDLEILAKVYDPADMANQVVYLPL
jgi:hypothetical protein